MNERMIELYREASEFAYKICKEEGREGGTGDHIWNTLSTGRFAELIVQECLLALETDLYESDIEYRVDQAFYKKCERIIKKHFGVEE